jgi:hypothetical protein
VYFFLKYSPFCDRIGLDIFVSKFIFFVDEKLGHGRPNLLSFYSKIFVYSLEVYRGSRARTRIYGDGTHKIDSLAANLVPLPSLLKNKNIFAIEFSSQTLTKKARIPTYSRYTYFQSVFLCLLCRSVCLRRGVAKRRLKAISSREAPNCRRKTISLVNEALRRVWDFTLSVFKKRLALDTLNGFGEGQGEQ